MEDISLHILDIAENSVAAGASVIIVTLADNEEKDLLTLDIADNGKGMSAAVVDKVLDPFYTTRTTRKIGLGLSLLSQSAREADGDMLITSVEGKGTQITAYFRNSHPDRKPLGNLADTFSVLVAGNPDIDFIITCSLKGKECQLDTRLLRADLEEVPLNAPEVIAAIRKYLKEALARLD